MGYGNLLANRFTVLSLQEVEVPFLPEGRLALRRVGDPRELDHICNSIDRLQRRRWLASILLLDTQSDVLVVPFVPTAIIGVYSSEEQVWPRVRRAAAVPASPAPAGVPPHLNFQV